MSIVIFPSERPSLAKVDISLLTIGSSSINEVPRCTDSAIRANNFAEAFGLIYRNAKTW